MVLKSFISVLFIVDLCVSQLSGTILRRQDSLCDASTGPQHPSCWTALGYDNWFDTWKGPCPGPPGCACDTREPWSDCVMGQYQTAIGGAAKTSLSCMDLTRPDLCDIPSGDWSKLSENQLAVAYASTAVRNLYHFIHGWYIAATQTSTPSAVPEILFNQITSPVDNSTNQCDVHIATYLTSIISNYSTDTIFIKNFKTVVDQVIGEDYYVNAGSMNIHGFQLVLGQAFSKILNSTLSSWDTPYFKSLSRDGVLLANSQFDTPPQLNISHIQTPPNESFDIAEPLTSNLTNTGRNLLTLQKTTDDVAQTLNYTFVECNAGEPGSLAEQLSILIRALHNNLQAVMHETTRGKRSRYGFSQLWATKDWRAIRDFYQTIYENPPLDNSLASYGRMSANRPVFVCLQPHNAVTWAAYQVCKDELRLRAFQMPDTPNLIGLCPSFWALPQNPPRAFCPYKGRLMEGYIGTALQLNQQSILVHQLVRIHLGRDNILDPERYHLGDAMKLTFPEAYRNPSTWAYWFASVIGCTELSWGDPEL